MVKSELLLKIMVVIALTYTSCITKKSEKTFNIKGGWAYYNNELGYVEVYIDTVVFSFAKNTGFWISNYKYEIKNDSLFFYDRDEQQFKIKAKIEQISSDTLEVIYNDSNLTVWERLNYPGLKLNEVNKQNLDSFIRRYNYRENNYYLNHNMDSLVLELKYDYIEVKVN